MQSQTSVSNLWSKCAAGWDCRFKLDYAFCMVFCRLTVSRKSRRFLYSYLKMASSCYKFSELKYLLSSIFYLLSSIFYLLSSIFYLLSSIFYLLSFIFYLLSSIFYLLCAICNLWYSCHISAYLVTQGLFEFSRKSYRKILPSSIFYLLSPIFYRLSSIFCLLSYVFIQNKNFNGIFYLLSSIF